MSIKCKENHSYILVFTALSSLSRNGKTPMRWVEHIGDVLEYDLMSITFVSPMGGKFTYDKYILCENRKQMMKLKDKLNSEIVKEYEPDLWNLGTPKTGYIWRDTYKKTHQRLLV